MDVVVEALSDHPELVPVAAGWHWAEWGHTDPSGSLDSWAAALGRQADASEIPGTLIALVAGSPVAVVCLVGQDMPGYEPAAGLGPWIKGLYVIPPERGHGHGQLLVRRCEAWARSLGHDALYLYTRRDSAAEALYKRLGWQTIHIGCYEDMDVTVMRTGLQLSGCASYSG
jgi:GNAT superfamily N-acetyltransferase